MTLQSIVHQSFLDIAADKYICTSAMYAHPTTHERLPIIEQLSQDFNDDANVLYLFGDNASGKSLISTLLTGIVKEEKFHVRAVSMSNRIRPSMGRAFVFGDETRQSTGESSIRGIKSAFDNSAQEETPTLIILDEPDLGLSPKYARALGRYIAQKSTEVKAAGIYVLVISHNPFLISSMREALCESLSYVGLNTALSLDQWLESDEEKTIDELLALSDIAKAKETSIDKEIAGSK
jgi:energy-coupling factor transporter ATP-binding protein EcfA2